VSIPILTSVTAPAGVVQVSPASSSPTLTAARPRRQDQRLFFRTITSDALQGTAAAKYAIDQGLKKLAIIHVNNDFGVNMVAEFRRAYEALGGTITSRHALQRAAAELQRPRSRARWPASRRPCISSATPGDGTTIARAWISAGRRRRSSCSTTA
jgi:ABC-type branched-subunit amino acid transport system substrate-binding protein